MGASDVNVGYTAVWRHPVARRISAASIISNVGDFVGLSALIVLAFQRSGVLGAGAVFAVQALPALLVGTIGGPTLDRIPRRTTLVTCAGSGAVVCTAVAVWPTVATALLAAGLLGAIRAATKAAQSGLIAESVPTTVHKPLIAVDQLAFQIGQIAGYVLGASVALFIGASLALAIDAVTFAAAAAVLATLPRTITLEPEAEKDRPSPIAGLREIWTNPTLRLLAPLAWITMLSGAVPETLASGVVTSGWVPLAMAAAPAGTAVGAVLVGRGHRLDRVRAQVWQATWAGGLFGLVGMGIAFALHPILVVAGNFGLGLASAWMIAAMATFVRVTPPARMAQVTGAMIAALIVLEGIGALALTTVATAWGPAGSYITMGTVMVLAGLVSMRRLQECPEAEHPPAEAVITRVPESEQAPDSTHTPASTQA